MLTVRNLFAFTCFLLATPATVAETSFQNPSELPPTQGLPDLFTFRDGRPVEVPGDWVQRRKEMKNLILHYQYGRMPPRPDQVTAEKTELVHRDDGKGTEEWITLSIDSQHQLKMRMVLYLPKDKPGPYPVIIREEGTLGRTRQVPLFLEHGYAFVEYARHDLDPDEKGVVGPAQAAYPEYDWATLAVWAWGGMRVVDYLETRSKIDLTRIAITGHSRGGKMALLAGALDARFALVVPNGSGAGGAGASRVLGPGAESIGMNDKPHWYHERIQAFAENEDRLPFDQHFLKALVAPRALLCTESIDDLFANPLGTWRTSEAARPVYTFLGADPQRSGLVYRRGAHDSNDKDWHTLLQFAQWHFFNRSPKEPSTFFQRPDHSVLLEDRQAEAPTTLEFVEIGDSGNPPDDDPFNVGAFGAVSQPYAIANRKVSRGDYAAFLNAVAQRSDPHGLYHEKSGIDRAGKPGAWSYSAPPLSARLPIHHVSWFDALRYCNWLHHGRPHGETGERATEHGAYTLSQTDRQAVRQPGAHYFLPTLDEWYKAAYYDPSDESYHLFPLPDREEEGHRWRGANRSHYGMRETEDALWEWMETSVGSLFRGLRSDAWFQGNNRQAAGHFYSPPQLKLAITGFRVARPSPPRASRDR